MVDERDEERFVRRLPQRDGFDVERIHENTLEKRADFQVQRNGDQYLIEVKRIDEETT